MNKENKNKNKKRHWFIPMFILGIILGIKLKGVNDEKRI